MKTKFFKQSVSILMAVLTMISVLTVSVSAEELLPEEGGGAVCGTDGITATESAFNEPAATDVNYGGAIYTSGEIIMTDITFTSHENSDPADFGAFGNGGAIYASDELTRTEITFTGHENTEPGDGGAFGSGGAIYASDELTGTEITFTSHENSKPGDHGTFGNGGEIDNSGEITNPENTFDGFVDAEPADDSATNINISTVPVPDETSGESQLNVETPRDTEIPEPPSDTEIPEQAECFSDISEDISIPEALVNTESPDESSGVQTDGVIFNFVDSISEAPVTAEISDSSTADPIGTVAGIDIVGKVVPHPHPNDPEIEELRGKNHKITQEVGDAIVKIGESVIPFGPTISNFIRSRSPQAKDMDGAETAIDLVADTAAYAFPVAAPLVSVAKDIALKIRRLFN